MSNWDFSFYADEHIAVDFINHLRDEHNLKIHFVEERNKSRDDIFQFNKAIEKNSFLLTKDKGEDKGFLNHNKFPFTKIKGVIILRGTDNYYFCNDLVMLVNHRGLIPLNKKFILNRQEIRILSQNSDGSIKTEIIPPNKCPCDIYAHRK